MTMTTMEMMAATIDAQQQYFRKDVFAAEWTTNFAGSEILSRQAKRNALGDQKHILDLKEKNNTEA